MASRSPVTWRASQAGEKPVPNLLLQHESTEHTAATTVPQTERGGPGSNIQEECQAMSTTENWADNRLTRGYWKCPKHWNRPREVHWKQLLLLSLTRLLLVCTNSKIPSPGIGVYVHLWKIPEPKPPNPCVWVGKTRTTMSTTKHNPQKTPVMPCGAAKGWCEKHHYNFWMQVECIKL